MSDNVSSFNFVHASGGAENTQNIQSTIKRNLVAEEETRLNPKDRVELSQENMENKSLASYEMTLNPDVNKYIEVINRAEEKAAKNKI